MNRDPASLPQGTVIERVPFLDAVWRPEAFTHLDDHVRACVCACVCVCARARVRVLPLCTSTASAPNKYSRVCS